MMPPSVRSFPWRKGLLVPRTKMLSPLYTKPEGRRLADEPQRLQGAGTPRYKLEVHSRTITRSQHLALTLFRSSLALHLIKLVLNLRIWSMSSLVGLENFSRVYLASHELQQPQDDLGWGAIQARDPLLTVVCFSVKSLKHRLNWS
jgi:hypothetical protein